MRRSFQSRVRSRVIASGRAAVRRASYNRGRYNAPGIGYPVVHGNYQWLAYDKDNRVLGSVFTSGVEYDAICAARNKFGFDTVRRVDMIEE